MSSCRCSNGGFRSTTQSAAHIDKLYESDLYRSIKQCDKCEAVFNRTTNEGVKLELHENYYYLDENKNSKWAKFPYFWVQCNSCAGVWIETLTPFGNKPKSLEEVVEEELEPITTALKEK